MSAHDTRIGHGLDVHRFAASFDPQKPLKLAGVQLEDKMSLVAHSDGDVVLHAICDALLGAIGAGDIGQHFPDTSAAYKNADSSQLLKTVMVLVAGKGGTLINCDVTIVAQVPKVAKHREAMRAKLSAVLGIAPDRVNIKATTTEGLGYIGRAEGIACHAVVLVHCNT